MDSIMARFKPYSYKQGKFIPIHFQKQILPGTFEYTLHHLIENELDLSIFHDQFNNDATGARAYNPKILLKIILYAYSKGIVSSRKIEQACTENVIFMALSADTRPHFTTISDFISRMDKEIVSLFLQVLMVCDEQGLIGREMFAIDGCKLPSNAAKEWSGTKADFRKKAAKMEQAIEAMVNRHHIADHTGTEEHLQKKEEQYVSTLRKKLKKVRDWLDDSDDKPGKSGKPIKSNMTDNESAKMQTSKGVIQGYNGVTAVDSKRQIIVAAEAFGQGPEHDLLEPMVEEVQQNFHELTPQEAVFDSAKLTADSGFHSEANMRMLVEKHIDGYVADRLFRQRDPRFSKSDTYRVHKAQNKKFAPADFIFAEDLSYCTCPAGHRLYRSGSKIKRKHYTMTGFKGPKSSCGPCHLRSQCLRHPDRTPYRQVSLIHHEHGSKAQSFTALMRRKIDTLVGRAIYSKRLAVGEPPFAHIRSVLKLDRFTLRTKKKVDIQWKLFCIIHNLKKIHRYGAVST